jgi:hypothetical protein
MDVTYIAIESADGILQCPPYVDAPLQSDQILLTIAGPSPANGASDGISLAGRDEQLSHLAPRIIATSRVPSVERPRVRTRRREHMTVVGQGMGQMGAWSDETCSVAS